MSKDVLVRTWKDEECVAERGATDRLESPVGSIELVDAELDLVAGGYRRRGSSYSGGGGGGGSLVTCLQFSIIICNNTFNVFCNFLSVVIGGGR